MHRVLILLLVINCAACMPMHSIVDRPGPHGRMMGFGNVKSIDVGRLPEKDSVGAKTFARYCNQCHGLPSPSQHASDEWPAVLDRMRGNIASMGKKMPTDSEFATIRDYLIRNSTGISL